MAPATAQSSSKKKAPKVTERTESPAPSAVSVDRTVDSQSDAFESPYIKELQKNIRNINKKIANASKTDSLLAQHKGQSLDDLVATKVLNADQKAQILKKPALAAQLAQLEEQLAQYQKVHEQYRSRAEADKSTFQMALDQAKEEAIAEVKKDIQKTMHDDLLLLSQFLRLAAHRREEAQDPEADENQAIEGVLLAIYAGDDTAVASMLKLVNGAEDQILSVPGQVLETSYATVKTIAQTFKAPNYTEGNHMVEHDADPESKSDPINTYNAPSAAEAGTSPTNGHLGQGPAPSASETAPDITPNGVTGSQWDAGNDLSMSQEWVDVKVPGDPAETGINLGDIAAAGATSQSWADDQPDPISQNVTAAENTDGFHQVQRNRGRHDRDGSNFRGRGRGEWRGRGGHRGEGRGRGRGNRNSALPSRGPRRNEEL